jgi:DNA polymerase elongation subunit (family B)
LSAFYTNVQVYGSRILYRGIAGGYMAGTHEKKRIDYNPTLYVNSKKPTNFTTIHGEYVSEIKPGNIKDTRDFVNQYEGVEGFNIYGNLRHEYSFISENFSDDIDWDITKINVANIDIEVGSENGFPEPDRADEPITAITVKTRKGFTVFGCGIFQNDRNDVTYYKCRDEIDLIKRFIDEWSGNSNYPDIITGWNVKLFDIPYLVNRITKLLGEQEAKRLSPWGVINERNVNLDMGRQFKTYNLLGISMLDYIDLYKKYAPEGKSQESYKLDSIGAAEGVGRKLSYDEHENLHQLYKLDYQKFIEYNIRDVELVEFLDDKLKLIELVLTLAYDSKTNYEDAFTQVRMWDILIFNELKKRNIVIPQNSKNRKDSMFEGAFVKDPLIGMHNWVASFDLNSLYPHLIMQYNISPETFLEPENYDDTHNSIIHNRVSVDSLLARRNDLSGLKDHTLTPNGQFFSTKKQGFLPKMMEDMYNDRSAYKKKAIAAKKELETETDPDKRFEIEKRISRYNNLQLAKKVCLNSAYGALGNEFFRFFDIRHATAITTAGQLSIRWIEKHMNEYLNKILKTENEDYVIACDTDSMYLTLDKLVNKTIVAQNPSADTKQIIAYLDKVCEHKLQQVIDESYQSLAGYVNAFTQKMIMKREALADKAIWTAKKRYIMNVYNNEGVEYAKPKIKVMGLEMVKSSTPAACRIKLKESIDVIFNGMEADVIKFIDNFRVEFSQLPAEEISFPRGVNGLDKFGDSKTVFGKGTPIHVRGALLYNNLLKMKKLSKKYQAIKEGEKIKFLYLKEPNTIQSNIISFPNALPKEFDLHQYIDHNTQFDKSFLEPLKIILDSIGWKTEHVNSLESFFS